MHTIKLLGTATLLLILAGCGRWNATQCENVDMAQQGLTDGRSGYASDRFVKYQSDCKRFDLKLNHEQYRQGWARGNRSYCQPRNMFNIGKAGGGFPNVCPPDTPLAREYDRGKRIHTQIANIHSQIGAIDNELNQANNAQQEYNAVLERIAQDKRDMAHYKEGYLYEQAKADLATQRARKKVLTAQMIVATATSVANPKRRQRLMNEKQQLQNQLAQLQNIN